MCGRLGSHLCPPRGPQGLGKPQQGLSVPETTSRVVQAPESSEEKTINQGAKGRSELACLAS